MRDGKQLTLESKRIAASRHIHEELRAEVNGFLRENRIRTLAGAAMYLNTVLILGLWLLSYLGCLLLGSYSPVLASVFVLAMSFFLLAMEMGIMHDASHRSYSRSKILNTLLSLTIGVAGGSSIVWHHQHVKAHHCHPNSLGLDPDINTGGLLRFHPGDRWRFFHRWQHLYALPLYSLLALHWVWISDIYDAARNTYEIKGRRYRLLWLEIILTRMAHVLIYIVLPLLFLNNIWLVAGLYLAHWLLVGLVLSVTFQLAHVNTVQHFPGDMEQTEDDWAVRQLKTTADFAVKNRFLTWFIGGLNHQVEHHIFPRMCQFNYPKIQPVVKEFCRRHDIHYHEYRTLREAFSSHLAHLKALAVKPRARVVSPCATTNSRS